MEGAEKATKKFWKSRNVIYYKKRFEEKHSCESFWGISYKMQNHGKIKWLCSRKVYVTMQTVKRWNNSLQEDMYASIRGNRTN